MQINSNGNLKNKIIDLLSRRDYSYKELYQKLLKYTEDTELITSVLNEFVGKKIINEERYIENFITNKSKKFGSLKIKYLLENKTTDKELINDIYNDLAIDEDEIAYEQLQKKYKTPPQDQKEYAKYIRFLLSRGFHMKTAIIAVKRMKI